MKKFILIIFFISISINLFVNILSYISVEKMSGETESMMLFLYILFLIVLLIATMFLFVISIINDNDINIEGLLFMMLFTFVFNMNSYDEIIKSPLLQLHLYNKILNSESFQKFCLNKHHEIQNKFIYTSLKKEQKSYIDDTCNLTLISQEKEKNYKEIILTIKELKDDENKMILLKDYLESIK